MDQSISLINPELMRERGADAFDRGLGADDHDMDSNSPARKDWQYGWHARRIERSRETGNHITDVSNMVGQQAGKVASV